VCGGTPRESEREGKAKMMAIIRKVDGSETIYFDENDDLLSVVTTYSYINKRYNIRVLFKDDSFQDFGMEEYEAQII
jgi:hypothetical protein